MKIQPEKDKLKVSFFHKTPLTCPACGNVFRKEVMMSGGGRLIAKEITDELRRIYVPSKKLLEINKDINPLIYCVIVCPECLYATFEEDFYAIPESIREEALSHTNKRKRNVQLIFPILDFSKERNLFTGTASYMLAISCYSYIPKEKAPTFKKGLCSLRAAWLFDDLNSRYPSQNYDVIRDMMYRKAMYYYDKSLEYMQSGEERIDLVKNMGPDLDKNWGYQGLLYLSTLLLYKYGDTGDVGDRVKKLNRARIIISRVFGNGKSSKEKPSYILEKSKELYDRIRSEIEGLNAS